MAIPSDYIDTGVTIAHDCGFDLAVRAVDADVNLEVAVFGMTFIMGLDRSGAVVDCGDWDSRDCDLWGFGPLESYASRHILDSASAACPQPYLATSVSYSITGLRLIVTRELVTGAVRLKYRLWADGGSSFTLDVGGNSYGVTGSAPGDFIIPEVVVRSFQATMAFVPAPLTDGIVVSNIVWNLEADPITSDDLQMVGSTVPRIFFEVDRLTTRPPLKYTADVEILDAGGGTPAHTVRVGDGAATNDLANGSVTPLTLWRWATSVVQALLFGDWSTLGVVPPEQGGLVPLRRIPPKRPGDAPESWQPTTYQIASPVNVLTSANNCSGTGSVALSGTGNLIWTVTGGATVTRVLLEYWRKWNTIGDPRYQPDDEYRTTKHDYYSDAPTSDVWGWHYAYLDVDLTSPANGALTLSITWAAAESFLDQTTKTYVIPATTGRSVYRIDLLFPQEGGPWYGERVDSIAFSGFVNGVYQLHDLELAMDEDAYVKLHPRDAYSGLTICLDGSFATGFWGENPLVSGGPARAKDDESGLFSSGGGAADTHWGGAVQPGDVLQDLADEWNRMEGITTTYNDSGIDADWTDGTNTIAVTYAASWYDTVMSSRAAANVPVDLDASIYADGGADLCPVPAGTFILPFRHTLGMMLEAQVAASGGGREAPGTTVTARAVGVGTTLGTGTTDASGYVEVAIPTGTIATDEFSVVLEA